MVSPKYAKSHILKIGNPTNPISVQLYLDYACPFSAKIFKKIDTELIPKLESKHRDAIQFEFLNVIQPWHPTSAIIHEVAIGYAKVYPENFWKYSAVLFDNTPNFYDVPMYDLSRKEITQKLINLAVDKLGADEAKLWEVLKIHEDNSGTDVTKDLKYFTRYHRTTGVHVTPTVFVDGIVVPNLESSTPVDKMVEILETFL
ncbi:unnamed protein product [Kuraishia capsulata CBS 1993]|uniref:Thioredoxin-like fold domain-containing protein n=1 Tax=Kuraishia capsulata CBS 1993 TaxID=1382522 RepID=W6MFQ4_9ASCO|nr:uncharacterized protein KUCA_T00000419001 [Kuraishia capsulata CBS 1993]CDK24456.1 unnamed protein product [Kuraishia capsulata CBS 1993]